LTKGEKNKTRWGDRASKLFGFNLPSFYSFCLLTFDLVTKAADLATGE
jgi:hypothetical protein